MTFSKLTSSKKGTVGRNAAQGSLGGLARKNSIITAKITQAMIVATLLLAQAACSYIPFNRGELNGQPVDIPAAWDEVDEISIIQLETRGETGPYSVNLWMVIVDGAPHVYASDNLTNWIQHIQQDSNVRLGASGSIYELRAEREQDPAQFEKFAQAWDAKYGNRPRNENVEEIYLYKLMPRVP